MQLKECTNIHKMFEEEVCKISEEENKVSEFLEIKYRFTVISPLIEYKPADFDFITFPKDLISTGSTSTYEYEISN